MATPSTRGNGSALGGGTDGRGLGAGDGAGSIRPIVASGCGGSAGARVTGTDTTVVSGVPRVNADAAGAEPETCIDAHVANITNAIDPAT